MKNWLDDDLVLFHYGEHPRAAEIERALDGDAELRRRLQDLRRDLEAIEDPATDVDAGFEDRLWRGIEPRAHGERPHVQGTYRSR